MILSHVSSVLTVGAVKNKNRYQREYRTEVKSNEKKENEILKVLLCVLIAVFVIVSAAALLLVGFRSSAIKEQKKQAAMEALRTDPLQYQQPLSLQHQLLPPDRQQRQRLFRLRQRRLIRDVFWDNWYSTDGTAAINVYNISLDTVSFQLFPDRP